MPAFLRAGSCVGDSIISYLSFMFLISLLFTIHPHLIAFTVATAPLPPLLLPSRTSLTCPALPSCIQPILFRDFRMICRPFCALYSVLYVTSESRMVCHSIRASCSGLADSFFHTLPSAFVETIYSQ